MPKDGLIRLPDKIADALLQALAGIEAVRNDRLVLQRPDHDRPPNHDRKTDYNVLWRGRWIGLIWKHEYGVASVERPRSMALVLAVGTAWQRGGRPRIDP